MTQPEYEQKKRECWEEYKREVQWLPVSRYDVFCAAFDRAYALGKQEKDAEDTVISGWVARNSDGTLSLFEVKPERVRYKRDIKEGLWMAKTMTDLVSELFPDLTWDDDPIEVEITIIKLKER